MPNHNPPANKITQKQRDYIAEHLNERPRTKVAEGAGVSIRTVYRVVHELNGEIDLSRSTRHPDWWDEYIREHFPNECSTQIAQYLGTNKKRVQKIAKELGVRHTEEYCIRVKAENDARLIAMNKALDRKVLADKRRHSLHIDELRIKYGLPPKHKFKHKKIGARKYQVRWYLVRKYNYFVDEQNPYTLYYDEQTKRANEDYFTNKYGFRFESSLNE